MLQDEDFTDMLSIGAKIEDKYAHLFDAAIINDDIVKASKQFMVVINELQAKPQWVPLQWLRWRHLTSRLGTWLLVRIWRHSVRN